MSPLQKCRLLSICLPLAGSLLCSCAVPDRQDVDSVRVLAEGDPPHGCIAAGTAHVSVADRLAQLQTTDGAVQQELLALARRSALQLGGNAVVALTGVDNGSQSFAVYRCP